MNEQTSERASERESNNNGNFMFYAQSASIVISGREKECGEGGRETEIETERQRRERESEKFIGGL